MIIVKIGITTKYEFSSFLTVYCRIFVFTVMSELVLLFASVSAHAGFSAPSSWHGTTRDGRPAG